MKTYKIESSQEIKGEIRHAVKIGDRLEDVDYFDVRAGLSWDPPFAVVCGEQKYDSRYSSPAHNRGVLRVTEELEGSILDLAEFFDRLSDAVSLHRISEIYADVTEEAFREAFQDWAYSKRFRMSLVPAPYSESPAVGISLIRSWDKDGLLRIDKDTQVYKHLSSLSDDDLENLAGSLNALRFVLGGFSKYPPIRRDPSLESLGPRYAGKNGWMLA
jgi:hypothetical protein